MEQILNWIITDLNGTITLPELLLSVGIAFLIAAFILWVYKVTYTGVVYSNSFALSILLLAMVTSIITRTISSNITLSLGMVGALSIVRFRTAVKEPLDTAFMFWAIAAGIMTGAGLYLPSIIGSLLVGVLFFVAHMLGFKVSRRYLLVIRCDTMGKELVEDTLKTIKHKKMRNHAFYNGAYEYTYEVEIKTEKEQTAIVSRFDMISGVDSCSLVAYQNDFGE
ncbi:MAG: DUF4956 domain-containing protein [Erysipelotrichaceae bacterium]|nr:DUF4956 domain-containing protein [Erysipelotrichaceae bacterium]